MALRTQQSERPAGTAPSRAPIGGGGLGVGVPVRRLEPLSASLRVSGGLSVSVSLQPVPQPVVREQRRHHARGPDGGDGQRARRAVLPGLARARRASHPPGAGLLLVRIPAVRRGPHGHRHSRQPVRRGGAGPSPSLVDAGVATFHVKRGLRWDRRRTSCAASAADLVAVRGTTRQLVGPGEEIVPTTLPLKQEEGPRPAVLGRAVAAVRGRWGAQVHSVRRPRRWPDLPRFTVKMIFWGPETVCLSRAHGRLGPSESINSSGPTWAR